MADQSNMTVSLTIKVQGKDAQAELTKLNAQLKASGVEVSKVAAENKKAAAGTSALASGFKDVALAIAGVVSAGRAFAFFKQTVNELDDLRDMSLKTGIAIQEIGALDLIARKSGSSGQAIVGTFKFINKTIEEAARGSEEAIRAFDKLGTSWQEFYQLSDVDRLYAIIDGLEKLGTGATGAKTAQTLLGRSYQDLIPLIKDADGNLKGLVDDFVKSHPEIEKNSIAADKLNDQLADMGDELKKMVNADTIQGFEALAKSAIWAIQQVASFGDKLGGFAAWIAERSRWGAIGKQVLADEAGPSGGMRPGDGYGWGETVGEQTPGAAARPGIPQEIMDANRRFEEIAALEREALATKNDELAKQQQEAYEKELESFRDHISGLVETRKKMTIEGLNELEGAEIEHAYNLLREGEELDAALLEIHRVYEDQRTAITDEATKKRLEAEKDAADKAADYAERMAQEREGIQQIRDEATLQRRADMNGGLGPDEGFFSGMKEGMKDFRRAVGTDFDQGRRAMEAGLNSIADASSRAFDGFINGSQTAAQAMRNFAASVLQDISSMIVRMMVLRAAQQAVGLLGFGGGSAGSAGSFGVLAGDVNGGGTIGHDFGPGMIGPPAGPRALAMSPGGGASGGTVIVQNYNISAVDQASVAKLFATPEFQRAQRGAQINNEKFNKATRASRR